MQLSTCLNNFFCLTMLVILLALMWQIAYSVHMLARIREYRALIQHNLTKYVPSIALVDGIRLLRDIPYGVESLQCMDVYLPEQTIEDAPVIMMVHGGGWRRGDKALPEEIQNKIARWVPKGFIFISVNYRLLPKTPPLAQCEDICTALMTAQTQAASWGGDRDKFILMGHSAGAHLVALLNSAPEKAWVLGARPWLGTIALDSVELDIPKLMETRHNFLHDNAFGDNHANWRAASPYYNLTGSAPPYLLVCATQSNNSYPQAINFASRAHTRGVTVKILQQEMSHGEVNELLGLEGEYTTAVEDFMGSLDPTVKQMLTRQGELDCP